MLRECPAFLPDGFAGCPWCTSAASDSGICLDSKSRLRSHLPEAAAFWREQKWQLLQSSNAICLPNLEMLMCQHIVAIVELDHSQKFSIVPELSEVLRKQIDTSRFVSKQLAKLWLSRWNAGRSRCCCRFGLSVIGISLCVGTLVIHLFGE